MTALHSEYVADQRRFKKKQVIPVIATRLTLKGAVPW